MNLTKMFPLLVCLLSQPAQAQILAEDIDSLEERRSFHILCSSVIALVRTELVRDVASVDDREFIDSLTGGDFTFEDLLELLRDLADVHANAARGYGATDEAFGEALRQISLINNSSVTSETIEFRLEARMEFVTTYCMTEPE